MFVVGRYQIGEKLGQGGMGTVYKAFDPLIERVVAVKVLSTQLDSQPDQRERFFREARAVGQLSHRNIITIYDLGEQDGRPYLAMEYLEGRDLEARLRRGPALGVRQALALLMDVCEGLAHAHGMGIVHRDIKPGNIFLTRQGAVKLLDFGLARMVSSDLTRSNVMIGTMNYMAPEQVRAERTDHRADIFSLGVVAYELLSGRRAFQADSFAGTIYKILQEVPEPLAAIDPSLPAPLAAIVERAMAKDKEHRYQAVSEMLADLGLVAETLRGSDQRPMGPDANWLMATGGEPSDLVTQARPALPGPTDAPTGASTPIPARARDSAAARTTPMGQERDGVADAPTIEAASPLRRAVPQRLRWLAAGAAVVMLASVAAWAMLGTRAVGEPTPSPPSTLVDAIDRPPAAAPAARAEPTPPVPAAPAPPTSRSADEPVASAPTAATSGNRVPEPSARAAERAASGMREARRSLEAGNVREAAQAATGVLAVQPGNREAAELLRRLDALARKAVDDAAAVAEASRAAAVAAGARELAAQAFDTAARQHASAAEQQRGDDVAAAAERFYEASRAYRRAEADARVEAEARAARARAATAEASRPAAPAPPPAPVPPAAPAATAPKRPGQEAAVALLQRYRAALEARSLPALRALWPTLGGEALAALQNEFQNSRSIEVELTAPRFEASEDGATVTVRRRYRLQTRDGQRLATETLTTLTLRIEGDEWVIDGIRHLPVR